MHSPNLLNESNNPLTASNDTSLPINYLNRLNKIVNIFPLKGHECNEKMMLMHPTNHVNTTQAIKMQEPKIIQ